jgi:hypothetical protein
MSEALSFDETYYVLDIVDECDPESLSQVMVDYTPKFDLYACFAEHLEVYLPFLQHVSPRGADMLIMRYYLGKKLKECAEVIGVNTIRARKDLLEAERRLIGLLMVLHVPTLKPTEKMTPLQHVVLEEPGNPLVWF